MKITLLGMLLFIGISMASAATNGATLNNELTKLRQAWKHEVEKYRNPPSKLFVASRVTILKELLNTAPTNLVEAELQRICANDVPTLEKNSNDLDKSYETVLLQALIAKYVDQRDRSTLVRLLSRNCPRTLEHLLPLEYDFAEKWPDSIYAIFEAYKKAPSNRVKEDLISCLGRSFASLRERFHEDSIFIQEAEKWYAKNQAKLKMNDNYPFLSAQPPTMEQHDKNLFLIIE